MQQNLENLRSRLGESFNLCPMCPALTFCLAEGQGPVDVRCFECEKESDKAIINDLSQELAAHRRHIQSLTSRLEQVQFDFNSKCEFQEERILFLTPENE